MSQAAPDPSFGPTIPFADRVPAAPERTSMVSMLLTAPERFGSLVAQDRFDLRASLVLGATAVAFYALYGVAVGVFSGGNALWLAMVKAPLVLVASLGLCAPSLYVLLCLNRASIRARQLIALLCGVACLSSVLLVGFAPVAWLFGVSTDNLQFMVLMHLVAWGVAIACGLRLLAFFLPGGYRANRSIVLWAAVFLVVSAQMLTYFRPVVGPPVAGAFREASKKFFFQHFCASMLGEGTSLISDPPPVRTAGLPQPGM